MLERAAGEALSTAVANVVMTATASSGGADDAPSRALPVLDIASCHDDPTNAKEDHVLDNELSAPRPEQFRAPEPLGAGPRSTPGCSCRSRKPPSGSTSSTFYELIRRGQVHTIHVGRLRTVPIESFREFVDRQSCAGQDDAG